MAKKATSKRIEKVPVHVVFGKDEFLRSRTLSIVIRELLGDEDPSTSLAMFDGANAGLIDILDDLRTPSMFSPLRIVCVRDADQLFTRDGDDDTPAPAKGGKGRAAVRKSLTARELMEKYLEKPCETGVLVLECKTWAKTTRLYKLVDKIGVNHDCEPPKEGQFESWARQHAREEFGCTFAQDAASRLVELVGENAGLLHMEISKLATYAAPRTEICADDVNTLVGESRTEIVFKLMNALTAGDAPGAVRMWHQVLAGGRGAEYMALGGLRFAFERLYNAKRMHEQGASAWDIKSALRLWDPENLLPKQLSRFTLSEATALLRKLLRIDVNSKTGLGSIETSIERLFVETCAAK